MEAKAPAGSRLRSTVSLDEFLQCPSCDCKLQRSEVKAHFEQEMQHLLQLQQQAVTAADAEMRQASSQAGSDVGNNDERRKPWTVFQRVQRNRHSRLRHRTRKRPPPPIEHPCPVCNLSFAADEIQRHAEQCLRRLNDASNELRDGSSSNEDEEEYEEYEWAGQKRIRASSLLQGGYSAIGIGQSTAHHNGSHAHSSNGMEAAEEEEDLNVDEDDTQIYGPAQYGEGDVIPPETLDNGNSEDNEVANYMRRLITSGSTNSSSGGMDTETAVAAEALMGLGTTTESAAALTNEESNIPAGRAKSDETNLTPSTGKHYQQIIESLKAKLRNHEQQVQSKFKCLICLDDYRKPAISVSCWHVHCEECWLRSLGARKLCPQCNLITTPKDLRRIYI